MAASLLISELADRTGFTPSTLRYYERVGLLNEAERSRGGYRLYGEAAVARLRFIDRAKQLGLPLEEIRELVGVWDGGLCAHVQERLRAHVAAKASEVRTRIESLTTFVGQLDAARTALLATAPDGPCGDGCGCVDPAPDAPSVPQLLELTPTRRLPATRHSPATQGTSRTSGLMSTTQDRQAPPVPLACTLGAADQPGRLAEWTELLAQVKNREAVNGGLLLRFPSDASLAGRLADLAAREQGCCAFFTFTLRLLGAGVELEVTAPADAAGVVAELFGTPE